MSDDNTTWWSLGCTVVMIAIGIGAFYGVGAAENWITGCDFCSEYQLTRNCAKERLKEACGSGQSDISVISLEGNVKGYRQVIYEFKRLPAYGSTTSAATMRGRASLVWDASNKQWLAGCAE